MVKVHLIGYNGDIISDGFFGPETISAAFARISRDPASVLELLVKSRSEIKKARKSNAKIIYGMGHHSVAEHAIFNYAILNLSRRAIEELELFRIGSAYTEKSQRYITLDGDFVMPEEFSTEDKKKFSQLVNKQVDFYHKAYEKLVGYQKQKNPNATRKIINGAAKEDARYVLSMATEGQLGFSCNGRTLEHTIRKMRNSKLAEVRELSRQLYNVTKDIAPSLIALADSEEFEKTLGYPLEDKFYKNSRNDLEHSVDKHLRSYLDNLGITGRSFILDENNVNLVNAKEIDKKILTALIYSNNGESITYKEAEAAANYMVFNGIQDEFMKDSLKSLSKFDALPREFEHALLQYDLVVDSSNFAQLKRHRMMTLSPQRYDPHLGWTIPESIQKTGLTTEFEHLMRESSDLFEELKNKYMDATEYVLTNAHRRRVLISVNPRELHHISRLREDAHAQWDIRHMAHEMLMQAKEAAPLTFMLAGGKHEFDKIRNKVYSTKK